jgi:hypothetical protein
MTGAMIGGAVGQATDTIRMWAFEQAPQVLRDMLGTGIVTAPFEYIIMVPSALNDAFSDSALGAAISGAGYILPEMVIVDEFYIYYTFQ